MGKWDGEGKEDKWGKEREGIEFRGEFAPLTLGVIDAPDSDSIEKL